MARLDFRESPKGAAHDAELAHAARWLSRQAVPNARVGRALRVADPESLQWISDLRSEGEPRHRAIARLQGLLLRAAGFEVARRRARSAHLGAEESSDIALQAAADTLVGVLIRLDHYRGLSRFASWAYKFDLLEAAVAVRGRAWQGARAVGERRFVALNRRRGSGARDRRAAIDLPAAGSED